MTTMSEDTATDSSDDYDDPGRDVLLSPSEALAGPDRYPRMWNMSAGMAFFQAVIRPDTPDRPEYISVPMPSSTTTDLDTRGARIFAVARWNALWEAAQYRRRFFHDDTDADGLATLPRDLARIADLGDNNIVFIPRTQTRYYDYAPLFHLLPRTTLDRFGLPMLTGGQWPFWAELTSPDPYLPADFSQRLSRAWGPRSGVTSCPDRRRWRSPRTTRSASWRTTSISGFPRSPRPWRTRCGPGRSSTPMAPVARYG